VEIARTIRGAAGCTRRLTIGETADMQPEIRYTRSGGAAIAYQVLGDGERDLVYVPDYVSNLVFGWQSEHWRRFYEALAGSFRLILFDKRGTGLSDLGGRYPELETRMEDLHAVMDAAGSERAVLLGSHDGCSLSLLHAATYPERTSGLALFHPSAHGEAIGDDGNIEQELAQVRERWGTQEYCDELLALTCPTLLARDADRLWFANWLRVGATPAVAYALNRAWAETDLRDVLPAVHVPTIVLHRPVMEQTARVVAGAIPGARTVRVSGNDYWGIFLSPEIPDEVDRFVAGEQMPFVPETVLTTLLFTDIVGSTERAAKLGDSAWRDLLKRHHAAVRRELARFRGEERDTAGDGFFATFDGPARAIRCAHAIDAAVADLGLQVRAGIHTGECELHEGKVAGIAVSIGARAAAHARPREVIVTQTVSDLVAGSGFAFADRGVKQLKGVPGEWRLYAAQG
jgi:class 3 adenylate cyclase/pimeloyl-ACP methyl ester carboxylesterase